MLANLEMVGAGVKAEHARVAQAREGCLIYGGVFRALNHYLAHCVDTFLRVPLP